MPRKSRPMCITTPPPVLVQPHNRHLDLSGLTSPELAELRPLIVRLQWAGRFDPKTLQLVLTPHELTRLRELERPVGPSAASQASLRPWR
jgi:hypothetical protein